jgi:FAD/FMN-containing dehydrogenase
MNRRDCLKAAALLAGHPFATRVASPAIAQPAARSMATSRVRPGDTAWPSDQAWQTLNRAIGGRLSKVQSPVEVCQGHPDGAECAELFGELKNPYFIGDDPALTQTTGWIDAWTSQPSVYCVSAHSSADVAAAVDFARTHNLRLVVRGGGHSYLGTSNAPHSLEIWTRSMKEIVMHDAFIGEGCDGRTIPQPAVSVGAGAIWMHTYNAVTTRGGRYVQGGGCGTVGVAGLVQGGGFGSYSKQFGTAGSNLLEAEIVTADGQVRIANSCLNPELFWALKGGGAGTFGVVTRLTLRTHQPPDFIGIVSTKVEAKSDAAYRELLGRFVNFCGENLLTRHWGETTTLRRGNKLEIGMEFQGIDETRARAIWQPFLDWIVSSNSMFTATMPVIRSVAGRYRWDADFLRANAPGATLQDDRPGAPTENIFWSANLAEAGHFIHGFESVWLPQSLLKDDGRTRLVDALFAASRHWSVEVHFQKGLAGAPTETLAATRDTPMHPAVLDAFALAIIAGEGPPAFVGLKGHEPNLAVARRNAKAIETATAALKAVVPNAGAYVAESSFFQPDWQTAYWGPHYARLLAIKRQVDPSGLFFAHHGVGSEDWTPDGFTRLRIP